MTQDEAFTPKVYDEAFWNSEWEALTAPQRQCLIGVVNAAQGKDFLWAHEFNTSFKTIMSKALKPYLKWQDHKLYVSPDARALVAHAKAHYLFPVWRYLRHCTAVTGVTTIIQTQDAAFAEAMLQQAGWSEIDGSYFRSMAHYLGMAYTGIRKTREKADY